MRLARSLQSGFTLIELMIVLAVVGILSQLAMAQYNTYVARAQIAEAYALLSQPKARIVENVGVMREVPRALPEADLLKSKNVASITYKAIVNTDGDNVAVIAQLTALFSAQAHPWLAGEQFFLIGGAEGSIDIQRDSYNYDPTFIQQGRPIIWSCGHDRVNNPKWPTLVKNYCK